MLLYDDLERFDRYKEDFKRFKTITVTKTKHSIKIDYGKKKVFLNKNNDDTTNVLPLINKVKRDTQNYIDGIQLDRTKNNDIFWYYYNDESGVIEQGMKVAKIDLTAAYWTKAINLGVLSKKTIDYFESMDFNDVKEKKRGRLKALGSLATVKNITVYNYGVKCNEHRKPVFIPEYRELYMGICNDVAEDMQNVLHHLDGIYYYWDCIFIDPKHTEKAIELFNNLGYKCTVEKHEAKVFKSKYISYFCCPNKEGKLIQYPIKH